MASDPDDEDLPRAALDAFFAAKDEEALRHALAAHPILLDGRIDRIMGRIAIEQQELEARQMVEARRIWLAGVRTASGEGPGSFLRQAGQLLPLFERNGRGTIWGGLAAATAMYGLAHRHDFSPEVTEQLLHLLEDAAVGEISPQAAANDRAALHARLGLAYFERTEGDRLENLERAIWAYEQALSVRTRALNADDWATLQVDIGKVFVERLAGDRVENLERAIIAFEEALTVWTRASNANHWAAVQANLGNALRIRLKGDRVENLERAIRAFDQALTVFSRARNADGWAAVQVNLSDALRNRLAGNRVENLERAIEACEHALTVLTRAENGRDWATLQLNLGCAFAERLAGDRSENLERAIEAFEQALTVFTRARYADDWAKIQMNLGNALQNRLTGDRVENLERAIAAYEQALTVRTHARNADDWAMVQMNMASVFAVRIAGDPSENLERSIAAGAQALRVFTCARNADDWALLLMNLGNAFANRLAGDRVANLERAIAAYEQVLAVWTRERTAYEWAGLQMNLGIAFAERMTGNRLENLELALAAYEQALTVRTQAVNPNDWAAIQINLGDVLQSRLAGDRSENVILALAAYRAALSATPIGFNDSRRAAILSKSGRLLFEEGDFLNAAAMFNEALAAREAVVGEALTRESTHALIRSTGDIGSMLAYCRTRLGDPARGLEELEQARGIEIRNVLASDVSHLATLDESLRRPVEAARDRLQALRYEFSLATQRVAARTPVTIADDIRAAITLLKGAQKAAGIGEPTKGLQSCDILALAPEGGILIVPVVTRVGGVVYVIPHGVAAVTSEHVLDLPLLTSNSIRQLLIRWFDGYNAMKERVTDSRPHAWQAFEPALRETLDDLWHLLMGPILAFAGKRGFGLNGEGEILIVPTGGLSLLPLHAARDPATDTCVLDHHVVGYVPSFLSLQISRRRAAEVNRGRQGLLGLFNPQRDLAFSETFELPEVNRCFGEQATSLIGEAATSEALLEAAPQHGYLHLSCHGVFDSRMPERSALVLAFGERFDVRRIAGELRLPRCRMVVTAACETGLTAIDHLEAEQVGLPAAFLQAGVPAVIATLWPVFDPSTALFMARMYDLHLDGRMSPARAVRQAALELRHRRATPATPSEPSMASALRQAEPTAFETSPPLSHHPHDADYSSPFFWAAFVVVGT